MDWSDLPMWINQMDLVIAPVGGEKWAADTKSAIKWLEAALVRTPTLASATEPYRSAITDRVDGFLSKNDEWETNLEYALTQRNNREVGTAAYDAAISRFSAKKSAQIVIDGIRDVTPLRRFINVEGPVKELNNLEENLNFEPSRTKEKLPRSLQAKIFLNSYKL